MLEGRGNEPAAPPVGGLPPPLLGAVAPFLELETWIRIIDGDAEGLALYRRHYSRRNYADGRDPNQFVGPGENIVLTTPCRRALFVWRKFKSDDDQTGVNCAVFRNESNRLASDLIVAADLIADRRWPHERHYTYVNPQRVRGDPPGNVFLRAGWRYVRDESGEPRRTKRNKLLILERLPA